MNFMRAKKGEGVATAFEKELALEMLKSEVLRVTITGCLVGSCFRFTASSS
jgi:hypothetical protein